MARVVVALGLLHAGAFDGEDGDALAVQTTDFDVAQFTAAHQAVST